MLGIQYVSLFVIFKLTRQNILLIIIDNIPLVKTTDQVIKYHCTQLKLSRENPVLLIYPPRSEVNCLFMGAGAKVVSLDA